MSTDTASAGTAVRDGAALRAVERPRRPAEPGRAEPVPAPPPSGWRIPLAVLIGGMFMSILDIQVVETSLPNIQDALVI